MTKVKPIEFCYAVICDDIRREDNGKLIIIGAYAGDIQVSQLPVSMVFSLAVNFFAPAAGEKKVEVCAELNGKSLGKGGGTMHIQKSGVGLLSLGPLPLKLENPGELIFKIREGENEWLPIADVQLELRG